MGLLPEDEITERFENPSNLFNRLAALRGTSSIAIPGVPEALQSSNSKKALIVSMPETVTAAQIMPDIDIKLAAKGLQSRAANIIDKCLTKLEGSIDAVPVKNLPNTVKSMSDMIKAFEPEQRKDEVSPVQFHVYSPVVRQPSEFKVIEVNE